MLTIVEIQHGQFIPAKGGQKLCFFYQVSHLKFTILLFLNKKPLISIEIIREYPAKIRMKT